MANDSEFVAFWNRVLVPKFLRFQDILIEGFGKHSRIVFERGPVASPGERVLDVGCGFGDTAIALARQTGASGQVVGIDCCDAFLEIGRLDAAQAGVDHIDWLEGDAETENFDAPFDLWFSRFGTNFFSTPVAALRHLREQLKPGGRAMMIVWQARERNRWAALPREVVLQILPEPEA
ncbi:MAG TPA: class I SAM-dependent methyltransferase, partial [Gammaproteobacteria bacterium]|nr:class I SAM-dependent methyltransferase [Gammaproteobacteria bacterium]